MSTKNNEGKLETKYKMRLYIFGLGLLLVFAVDAYINGIDNIRVLDYVPWTILLQRNYDLYKIQQELDSYQKVN